MVFPPLLSMLKALSSKELNTIVIILFLWQLLSSLLFFNADCGLVNNLIIQHPLPRSQRKKTIIPRLFRLPVFVMGMAAGLIRLCNEEAEPNCPRQHITSWISFLDNSPKSWKMRVDLSSLLLFSAVLLAQVVKPYPPPFGFTPLANIFFVLPQLTIIMGKGGVPIMKWKLKMDFVMKGAGEKMFKNHL